MLLKEIVNKYKFCLSTDRIGPDIPITHWRLHFASTMRRLCKSKFKYFAVTAQFRAGAYAVGCSKIHVGERVIIRPGTMLFGETVIAMDCSILIEDDVMIGSGVHVYVNNHKFDDPNVPLIDQGYYPDQQVVLKKGCWIGANSIILPGVTIGENAVVGAGSIVTKSIPARTVYAGNPAKLLKII